MNRFLLLLSATIFCMSSCADHHGPAADASLTDTTTIKGSETSEMTTVDTISAPNDNITSKPTSTTESSDTSAETKHRGKKVKITTKGVGDTIVPF